VTAYFDDTHERISSVGDGFECATELDAIEEKLVFDCTVCAMFSDVPNKIREEVHQIVLRRGNAMLPLNAPGAVIETVQEHKQLLHDLCWDLHTTFHDLCKCGIDRLSDDPRMPLWCLYADGEGEREELVEKQKKVSS